MVRVLPLFRQKQDPLKSLSSLNFFRQESLLAKSLPPDIESFTFDITHPLGRMMNPFYSLESSLI